MTRALHEMHSGTFVLYVSLYDYLRVVPSFCQGNNMLLLCAAFTAVLSAVRLRQHVQTSVATAEVMDFGYYANFCIMFLS
jgi:hypothetical protein